MIDWAAISDNWQKKRLALLSIVLLLNVVGFCYFVYFLGKNGYLPSPFIYDKSDTFMDLFNVLYWAYDDGRYTEWGSVYPPLGFIVLRLVNFLFAGEGYGDPAIMRDNSQFVIMGSCLFYLVFPAILLRIGYWRDFLKNEKLLIYFLILFSSPMLFTLERGNIILLAPIFLGFALAKIGTPRSVYIAILINLKPYFALLMVYYIVRRNWRGFVKCVVLSGFVFLITGLALDNHFLVFLTNLFDFSQAEALFSLREIMSMPSSISAFSYVLRHPDGAMLASKFMSSASITNLANLVELIKWCLIGASLLILFIRSKLMRDAEILSLLVVIISNLGIWVGGYTLIFYAAIIPIIIKMRSRWLYVSCLSLIALPLDIIPLMSGYIGDQYSYLTTDYIEIFWTMGLGSVVRPLSNIILLMWLSREFFERKHKDSNNIIVHHCVSLASGCDNRGEGLKVC